jgi:hypothetical protein
MVVRGQLIGVRTLLSRPRARSALAFAAIGLLTATWFGRLPAVQDGLGLSTGELAVALASIEAGALAGLPLGGALVARWGIRGSSRLGFAVFAPSLAGAAVAPGLPVLCGCLAVWAAANSVLDVALNAEGVRLEGRLGRPVLGGLHAAQGAGLLTGAVAATAAAALAVPVPVHAGIAAALVLATGLTAAGSLPDDRSAPAARRRPALRPGRALVVTGLAAFCAFLVDAAAGNWVAVHLRTEHGASGGVAAAGYLALTGALVLGRLGADRLVARWSRRAVVGAGGLLVALGTGVVTLAPTTGSAVGGWVLVGVGVAPLAPVVLAAAPDSGAPADRAPAPVAIATVTTIGYVGSFTGPPLIGALAGPLGLSAALLLMAAGGLAAALLGRRLPPGRSG